MRMTPKLSLSLAAALVALSPAAVCARQPARQSSPQPFRISSRGTGFGLQGEFEGTFLVGEEAIEVFVSKATFHASKSCPYQGRRAVAEFNFSLGFAAGPNCQWDADSPAEPVAVGWVMSPGDESTLYDLYFKIPKPKGDLAARWLVVSIRDDLLDVPPEKRARGFSFAHSCREIFGPAGCPAGKGRKPTN